MQAEIDLATAPHSRAPAYSWQMERKQEAKEARRKARKERALREAARRKLEQESAPMDDMQVWAKL
jgi:hypothetical protein